MCALDEWPSHDRRRKRAQLHNETDGQKKKGRVVLKGYKASKKRFANGFVMLSIAFSKKNGWYSMNELWFIQGSYHSFKDIWDLEDRPETEEKIVKIAQERNKG